MKKLCGRLSILFLFCFFPFCSWSDPNNPDDYYLEFHVDWDEFVKINGTNLVPLGQPVNIPVVITEVKEWTNTTVRLSVGAHKTQFDEDNIADFNDGTTFDGSQALPILVYIPITVKGEGEFEPNLVFTSPEAPLMLIMNSSMYVFSFEGKVVFSKYDPFYDSPFIQDGERYPIDEMVLSNFSGQVLSDEQLQNEKGKLKQRYLAKYPKIHK